MIRQPFLLALIGLVLVSWVYAFAITYRPAESVPGCVYMASVASMVDGELRALRCDGDGRLLVRTP